MQSSPPLSHGTCLLRRPDGRTPDVVGSYNTSLSLTSLGDSSSLHTVHMVSGLKVPILEPPAMAVLPVLQTVRTVNAPATGQC